jgi:hypothetical protein
MKDLAFKNNGACDYMHGTLARMNRTGMDKFLLALKYLAWFSFAGCLVFVAYKCYLRRRTIKQSSNSALISGKSLSEPLASTENGGEGEAPASGADDSTGDAATSGDLKPVTVV